MPRVKRGTKRRAKRKKILDRASGYFLTKSKLYRSAKEAVERGLKFAYSGPQAAQAAVPLAVDRAHRRRRQAERDELQPVHPRAESRGYRTGPQDSGRPGGERSGRLCQPGDAGQGRDQRSGVGRCQLSASVSACARDRKARLPAVPSLSSSIKLCHSERSEEPVQSAGSCIGPSRKKRAQDDKPLCKVIRHGLHRSQTDGLFGGGAGRRGVGQLLRGAAEKRRPTPGLVKAHWKVVSRSLARPGRTAFCTQINDLWLKAAPKDAKREVGLRTSTKLRRRSRTRS